ncbi:unnamed protein product, partial [Symbiodinium pilosum]
MAEQAPQAPQATKTKSAIPDVDDVCDGLTFQDDLSDEVVSQEGGAADAADDEEASDDVSQAEDEPAKDDSLCACCQDEPRVPRSIYGAECKKALNNTEKQEAAKTGKKGERWAKWAEIKRAGGAELFSILMAYREKCDKSSGPGKARGSFDFMLHYEEMQSVAKVESGEKLVYMTYTKWLKVAQEDHAHDVKEAKRKWLQKKAKVPKHKQKKNNGVLLLPQYFVLGSNAQKHVKGLRFEGTKAKKPKGKDIEAAEKHATSGHLGFSDKSFAKVGGGDLVDNAQGGSLMFAPDGDSIFGEGKNFRNSIP